MRSTASSLKYKVRKKGSSEVCKEHEHVPNLEKNSRFALNVRVMCGVARNLYHMKRAMQNASHPSL